MRTGQTQSRPQSAGIHRRRVLLIEDTPTHWLICQEAIQSQTPDTSVEITPTAAEGLERAKRISYDAIVMDYNLPDMDGSELIRRLRVIAPSCPIVVITGEDDPNLALEVLRHGASDYLPKYGEYHKFLPRAIITNTERMRLQEELSEMYMRVQQANQEEALLNRMIVSIHSSLEVEDVIDRAANGLSREFLVSRAIICLINEKGQIGIARQVTQKNLEPISDRSMLFSKYHDLLLDIGERRPLVVMLDDTFSLAQDVRHELVHYGILSMVMVPLVFQGRLTGLLHLDQSEFSRLWTAGEINNLTRIGNQFSIALSQARLYKIVESQNKNIDKLTELCSQLNEVVSSTRELTEKHESHEKVRIKLSTREIEVLRKVARGLSNKEIAEALHITEGTTEVHVSRLRKKLILSSRAGLVRYAFENHLS